MRRRQPRRGVGPCLHPGTPGQKIRLQVGRPLSLLSSAPAGLAQGANRGDKRHSLAKIRYNPLLPYAKALRKDLDVSYGFGIGARSQEAFRCRSMNTSAASAANEAVSSPSE